MNILVTGGAGFIGSNLVRYLIKQPETNLVVNLDMLTYAGNLANVEDVSQNPKYKFFHADIRDRTLVAEAVRTYKITHIIHLAAESHVDRSIGMPSDFVTTNVIGTFNLLEIARNKNLRFHHVSTDEVFGSINYPDQFTEDSPYKPNSPYSATKASSDHLVRSYCHTYGLNGVITNCSNNYGPNQYPEKLTPVIIQKILNKKPIPIYGNGLNIRDWLYVKDHVESLWKVLRFGDSGETYNIGGRTEKTNLEIVWTICDLINEVKPGFIEDPKRVVEFVKDRPGHDVRYSVNTDKIHKKLEWYPKYTFEAGMRETVFWYLTNQQWVERVLNKNAY